MWADLFGKALKDVNAFYQWRKTWLKSFFFIIIECELEIIAQSPFIHLTQEGEKRRGIFAPENHCTTVCKHDFLYLGWVKGIFP